MKAGCDVAVRTECLRDPTNDAAATEPVPVVITKGQGEHEWLQVQATSHLLCDFDFVADYPTWTVYRFESLRLSPCGADSAFVAERLGCGREALVDVSYCRMQTTAFGELPVSVRQSHLQWRHDMVHLHVTLNVTATKEKFMALRQHQHQQRQELAALALDASSIARELDISRYRYAIKPPESCFGAGNAGVPTANAIDAPAPLPAEAAAMLQLRLKNMDDLLFAIKAAAALLFAALLWAVWQLQKPGLKPSSQQPSNFPRSGSHPQSARSTELRDSNDDNASSHYHTLPTASRALVTVPDKSKARDHLAATGDAAASVSSMCNRLEQDWTLQSRPLPRGSDGAPRRVLKPIAASKRNPFAATWIRASAGPRPTTPVGGGDPRHGMRGTAGNRGDDGSQDGTDDDSSGSREATDGFPRPAEPTARA